jgi:DNA polymerase-3 subunit delta'
MAEAPHPRDVYDYEGGEAAEAAFLDALGRGRLHHAWLLTGPQGVGKATFAFRAARRLLGAAPDPRRGLLGASESDPTSRIVAARAHPDLMVLERATEDGKPRKTIPVDEARLLPEFFAKAPSRSAYRVAIIDAVDDMNVNAANALLKTLEEPPERGVLFLVSHSPGRLLATIRSRCRRLAFHPWDLERTAAFVRRRTEVDPAQAERLAEMARGAPGRALELAASKALELDVIAQDLVAHPDGEDAALLHLADGFRGGEGQARFELFFDRLAEAVRGRALAAAGSPRTERWATLWDRVTSAPGEAEALNLDRADVFWTTIAELRSVAAA